MRLGLASLLLCCAVWGCGRTRQDATAADGRSAPRSDGGDQSVVSSGGARDSGGANDSGGAPSPTAGAPASEAGEASTGGASDACSAQVVTAAGAVSCSPYEVLTPGCFAPPSQNGRYAPVAAWATDAYPSHTLRGGRRSFYSAGYFRESSAGWVASPYCTPDGPFQVLAFDEESSVTASRGALGGTWELRINGTPLGDGLPTLPTRAAVSAATLILDDDYYVRDGADWSPLAHALPWTSAKVVGLGSDRFARFVDETGDTELTRRMGATWVAFGHVPATDDASMTPEGVTPARIAINSHNGASVYKQDQADWVLEKSFAPGTVPSLGSRAGVTTLVMPDASGVHVLSPDDNWQETDLIPLSGAQALASDGVVIVESTDPSYLAKLPELSAGRPPASLVVVYATVE